MKTALVTGGAGFVGRYLIPKLQQQGYVVTCVDPLYLQWPSRFEELEWGDEPFDVVVHLAANIPDVSERFALPISSYQDIALDLKMTEYLLAHPPKECVVWPSSCAIDNPKDPYAWVKLTAEKFCAALHKAGVPVVILRPFSGYGWGQALSYPFPAIFDRAMRHEDPLTVWGSGYQIRDWIHVRDLVAAFIWAIHFGPRGLPIEVGTGSGTSLRNLAEAIATEVGYHPVFIQGDESKPASSDTRIANVQPVYNLGFRAVVNLEEGIHEYHQRAKEKHGSR